MRNSILVLVLAAIASAFAAGCASTGLPTNIAFEPRAYPYSPELGPSPETSTSATK
jgi:hypothetical protein